MGQNLSEHGSEYILSRLTHDFADQSMNVAVTRSVKELEKTKDTIPETDKDIDKLSNTRLNAEIGSLNDVLNRAAKRSRDLKQDPDYCAIEAFKDRLQQTLELKVNQEPSHAHSSEPAWNTVDNSVGLLAISKQRLHGDASCGGHAIAWLMNSQGSNPGIDPYEVYEKLRVNGKTAFGLAEDLKGHLDYLKDTGVQTTDGKQAFLNDYRILSSNTDGSPVKSGAEKTDQIKAAITQGQRPLVFLKTQARSQREDWVSLMDSPMGHIAAVVGYGNEINPFTGKSENYFLVEDSYGVGRFPMKYPAEEMKVNLQDAALLTGVTVK